MTYKRKDLPQIREIDVHKSSFPYKKFKVAPRKLIPSQTERVPALLKKAKGKFPNPNPIIIDIDYRIINGHHRYDAALELGVSKVPVLQIQTTVKELIRYFVKNKS